MLGGTDSSRERLISGCALGWDRSLVTVGALIAAGQAAQFNCHLNRAMDNRLTRRKASEVRTINSIFDSKM